MESSSGTGPDGAIFSKMRCHTLLVDFERVLGPDQCGRDLGNLTLDQRQRQAHQRWTARGGASIPYFAGIAAALGVAITVQEFWRSDVGGLVAGDELIADGEQFTWLIELPLISQWTFVAGGNQAGDPLGGFSISDIECELRRLKPRPHPTRLRLRLGA